MVGRILFIGALWSLCGMSYGYACSPAEPEPTKEELFRKATAVFAAHLVRVEEVTGQLPYGNQRGKIVEGTFQVVEVLKGKPPADQKIRSLPFGPGNCTVPILAGTDYVFFLRDDAPSFVSWPNGTQMIWSFEADGAQTFLSELRALKN
jgi:hypothetical protein